MLFNSAEFLGFFLAVWVLVQAVPRRLHWLVLLPASYVFYMAWEPAYAGLLILSTVVDWVAGARIHRAASGRERRRWLGLSLATNLGVLFTFKYFNFFTASAGALGQALGFAAAPWTLTVLLPVGISFYTFQTLSYTLDIYRGRLEPEPSLGRFALFVAFFPQLVAGPIERASHLLPQIRRPAAIDTSRVVSGLQLALWGFFKKLVVADRLAPVVEAAFDDPSRTPGLALAIALYFFAFQILCDFSGYSDIAIGVARTLGYDFRENFRRPYFARSFAEFWHRWHISLSTWFRDYVYIELGGSRTGHTVRNILVVFVVSGLWHGAAWGFVLWGLIHGLLLVAERAVPVRLPPSLARFGVFHGVVLAWVLFRAPSLPAAASYLHGLTRAAGELAGLVRGAGAPSELTYLPLGMTRSGFLLTLGILFFFVASQWFQEHQKDIVARLPRPVVVAGRLAWYDVLLFATLFLGVFTETRFIYFQF